MIAAPPVVNARSRNLFCAGAVGVLRAPGLPCALDLSGDAAISIARAEYAAGMFCHVSPRHRFACTCEDEGAVEN